MAPQFCKQTQNLCEINFGGSRSAKSAFLIHLETQNFDLYEVSYLLIES